MFYNSKKLIDEKVLQQYFFEQFMMADSSQRSILLPKNYRTNYSKTEQIKALHPEVVIGVTSKNQKHITDFVLYPAGNQSKLNIEIKWNVQDFEKQIERFEFYDGTKGKGFVVAMDDGKNQNEFVLDPKGNKTNIPVVYLSQEDFKSWFSKNAYDVVSQALSVKLNTSPSRITGEKYWVIVIAKESLTHYKNHGKPHGIWAFKDRTNPKEIIKVLNNDYVVFVNLSCKPARMIFPDYRNKNFKPSDTSNAQSKDIEWHLNFVDIFKITKGYHLDFSDIGPYNGFDEKWMKSPIRKPENKNYTQFIKFSFDKNDKRQLSWNKSANIVADRKLFPEQNKGLVEFVNAVRDSLCVQGDVREISRLSFEALIQVTGKI